MIQAVSTVLDFAPAEWSPGKRLVAIAVADRVNAETLECFPSMADIARRTGLSERQVRRYMRELEAENIVVLKERRYNNSNVWIWTFTALPTFFEKVGNVVNLKPMGADMGVRGGGHG